MNWNIEDELFWKAKAEKIAYKNLYASIFILIIAFMAWMVWSSYIVYLKDVRPDFSESQLYWLTALPLLSAGFLRIIYSFVVPIFGGRNFSLISTGIILVPMSMMLYAIFNPSVDYTYYVICSLLTGLPGANFASSSANISFFFPHRLKGIALGFNAAIGNMGVGVIQLISPWIILFKTPLSLKPSAIYLENIPLLIIVLTIIGCVVIFTSMDNLEVSKASLSDQLSVIKDSDNWIMCILYSSTFGSFIGLASVFPIVLFTQFNSNESVKLSFSGALLSSLMRPVGHILSKKIGSVYTTQFTFILMIVGSFLSISFLPKNDYEGNVTGTIISFLILFLGTGIGKGSTTSMIPDIYRIKYKKNMNGNNRPAIFYKKSLQDTASVLGFTSAIATIAAFFIPNILSVSEYYFNDIKLGMYLFIAFFIFSFIVTYFFYMRKSCNNPFYTNSKIFSLIDTPKKQEAYFKKMKEKNEQRIAS